MSQPERWQVRVGDAERQAMVDDLRTHFGEGRLTLPEFEERTELALAARTRADLVPLVADLPALRPAPRGAPVRLPAARSEATWDVAMRIHTSVVVVLCAFFLLLGILTRGVWPIWVIAPLGLTVGVHAAVKKAVEG